MILRGALCFFSAGRALAFSLGGGGFQPPRNNVAQSALATEESFEATRRARWPAPPNVAAADRRGPFLPSARGAPHISPVRERWENIAKNNPERRRCGTRSASFPTPAPLHSSPNSLSHDNQNSGILFSFKSPSRLRETLPKIPVDFFPPIDQRLRHHYLHNAAALSTNN